MPIIQTDLEIKSTRIGAWADIGVNAVILPGITVGKGSIVGAGAVVTRDVNPFSVVVGVPAKFLRWREGHEQALEAMSFSLAAQNLARVTSGTGRREALSHAVGIWTQRLR